MLENSRRDFHTRKKCDCVSLKAALLPFSRGGGGNYNIYRYGVCHFMGYFFQGKN